MSNPALFMFFLLAAHVVLGGIVQRDLNATLLHSYDYIIVGCGTAGLVVATRLSENPHLNILCIEAGPADQYEEAIQFPVYVGSDIGGLYDWGISSVPQSQLDGAARPIPAGKVLGGGTILNGMVWNRGGRDDFDEWEALGNPGWGWDGMLPYFRKSETYTPVASRDTRAKYSIKYDPRVHGSDGPVAVSYPNYFYPEAINFFRGLNMLGVPTEFDEAEAVSAGAAFCPSDLHPKNQTRADARRSYYDPHAHRPNLHVILGQQVTQVLIDGVAVDPAAGNPTSGNEEGAGASSGNTGGLGFGPAGGPPKVPADLANVAPSNHRRDTSSSGLRITGVQFASDANATRQTVYASREVIVSAGIHSPQLLQLSGIGPAPLLEALGIPVVLNLPGVGNNLQDHCLIGTFYPYNNFSYPSPTDLVMNTTYNLQAKQEYLDFKTGPWTAGAVNALAFPPLPLISNKTAEILATARAQPPAQNLIAGIDQSLIDGYIIQRESSLLRLGTNTSAAYEIINNNAGSLTVSVMHPLSRGYIYIRSADPFEPPAIDPRWLSDPVDREILIEALLFNRRILATPPMVELQPAQFVPPIEATIEQISEIIDNGLRTEFHQSCTCAMLPLEQGGVLDPHLRVWGTQNLRVVDAQSFPNVPAAHLQSVVYALAEKAADIIRADNVQPQYNVTNGTVANITSSGAAALSTSPFLLPNTTVTASTTSTPLSVSTGNFSAILSSTVESNGSSSPIPTTTISEATSATSITTGLLYPGSPNSPISSEATTTTGFSYPGSPNQPVSSEASSTATGFGYPGSPDSLISFEDGVATTTAGQAPSYGNVQASVSSFIAFLTSIALAPTVASDLGPSMTASSLGPLRPAPTGTVTPTAPELTPSDEATLQTWIDWLKHLFGMN